MEQTWISENKKITARLREFTANLTEKELKTVVNKEGWTVAVALAHVAFWDSWRTQLLKQWKKEGVKASPMASDLINDAAIPLFLAIPIGKIPALVVSIAEKLDKEIEELPPELVSEIVNCGEAGGLNRVNHRKLHLDDIENLLDRKK